MVKNSFKIFFFFFFKLVVSCVQCKYNIIRILWSSPLNGEKRERILSPPRKKSGSHPGFWHFEAFDGVSVKAPFKVCCLNKSSMVRGGHRERQNCVRKSTCPPLIITTYFLQVPTAGYQPQTSQWNSWAILIRYRVYTVQLVRYLYWVYVSKHIEKSYIHRTVHSRCHLCWKLIM